MSIQKIIVGLGLLVASMPAWAETPAQILASVAPSMVTILNGISRELYVQGSGVVVGRGVVVTPCFITSGSRTLVMSGQQVLPVESIRPDPYHGLCQLQVRELQAPAAIIAPSTHLRVGEQVYAVGADAVDGHEEIRATQILAIANQHVMHGRAVRLNTTLTMANRGGGIFDDQGHLIGIAATYRRMAVSIPAEWIVQNGMTG